MTRTGGRRYTAVALVALAFTALLVGCSQMQNPTYDIGASGCGAASDATVATIQDKVHAPGTLRNGSQLVVGDHTFVSAELHLDADDKHDKGDILTWVTPNAEGSDFFAVDVHARETSSWPKADVDVRAEGARESRACTSLNVGKTPAQRKCERDAATSQPGQGGRAKCDEL